MERLLQSGRDAKKTQRDEVTNVGSEITSGRNTVLVSGGAQLYQVAKLYSGKT